MSADSREWADGRSAYRDEQSRRVVAAFLAEADGAPDATQRASAEEVVRAGLEWLSLGRGEVLFRQGDPGDALYLVVSGRLRILLEGDGPPRVLNEVGRGELIGEMAVITGQPRSATVEAVRDAELVRLSRSTFDRLLEADPRAMMGVVRTLILRLQSQERRTSRLVRVTSFAVIPGGEGDPPLHDFCARLARALARLGSTLHLDRHALDAALGPGSADTPLGGEAHSRVLGWLTEREAEHRFLLYQADRSASEWTLRCVRQADRVLIVANSEDRAGPHAVERALLERVGGVLPRQELVLLHPGTEIVGTADWLTARAPAAHHHVRAGRDDDFARFVRRVTGGALGLVLGGGGARGLAHLGVIRALAEAGHAVDAIGGSSVGALVGALYAFGLAPDAIYRVMTTQRLSARDPALFLGSLLSGHATYAMVQQVVGDAQIEDLALPFACASSDLTRARVHVHGHGGLAKAVLASNAAPGILPPVSYGGELHVDGGLLANVPVEAVAPLVDGGPLVTVDVVPNSELRVAADYEPAVPGYAVLWSRLSPFVAADARPGLQVVLNRTIEVAGAYQRDTGGGRPGDLHLHPPLEGFSFGESKRTAELVEVGYRYARERIEQWKPPTDR